MQAAAPAAQLDPQAIRVPTDQLTASMQLMEAIAQEEGVRLTVYRDVAGNPTVGVGHRVTASDGLQVGDVISYDHAIDLLERDLAASEAIVGAMVGDLPLFQHEFDALVDLVYNVGEGTVSRANSPALHRAIANADHAAIAEELIYEKAGGSFAAGLAYRSVRRQSIFTEGLYEDPRPHDAALSTASDIAADIA
jgi:GH24 family phage-related lysozyme (muramidase)